MSFFPSFLFFLHFKQAGRGGQRRLGGVLKREACLDLIIADMPDGLPVPDLSSPRSEIPSWNELEEDWAEGIFEMARESLQDDGAILIFHPDILSVRVATDALAEAYGFISLHDWWGINEMPLTSAKNQQCTVRLELYHVILRIYCIFG